MAAFLDTRYRIGEEYLVTRTFLQGDGFSRACGPQNDKRIVTLPVDWQLVGVFVGRIFVFGNVDIPGFVVYTMDVTF